MTLWSAKQGPWWTVSRWCHWFVGFCVPMIAEAIWGYEGLGYASVAVLVGGVTWELVTRWLAPWCGWRHPWGDVVDLAAFVCGWLIAVIVCLGSP